MDGYQWYIAQVWEGCWCFLWGRFLEWHMWQKTQTGLDLSKKGGKQYDDGRRCRFLGPCQGEGLLSMPWQKLLPETTLDKRNSKEAFHFKVCKLWLNRSDTSWSSQNPFAFPTRTSRREGIFASGALRWIVFMRTTRWARKRHSWWPEPDPSLKRPGVFQLGVGGW